MNRQSRCLRDRGKHALVDSEQKVGYPIAADRWVRQNISEPEVGKITDELASGVRKGERISPKEPLERRDTRGHHREPDQRKSGLSSRKARVKEAKQRSERSDRAG